MGAYFSPGFARSSIPFYRIHNRELKPRTGEMSGKRKTSKKFIHIGEVLQQTLKSCRRETNETLAALGSYWPDVVGETLGVHSCPAAMKGKQLLVHVSSSVWLQEMRFLKDDLVDAINRLPGGPMVEDIKFKVGKV
jgi:predicted nucleic acid-binding Zn ribbon protein